MSDTRPLPGGMAVTAGRSTLVRVTVFFTLLVFYVLTAPANHNDIVDAYWHASLITTGSLADVPRPRVMLWLAGMQGLYSTASLIIPGLDPFRFGGFVTAVQAALSVVLLAGLLTRRFGLDALSAWLTAGLFAASYAIWRFAAELEVYMSAVLLCLVLLELVFRIDDLPKARVRRAVLLLAVAAGLSMLVYLPLAIVAGLVVPFYLVARKRLAMLGLYGAVAGAILLSGLGYAYVNGAEDDPAALRPAWDAPAEKVLGSVNPQTPGAADAAKMLHAVGRDVLSTNWMYAFVPVQNLLKRISPNNNRAKLVYAANQAGWFVWVPIVTLPVAFALIFAGIVTAWRSAETGPSRTRTAAMVLWIGATAAMMFTLAPSGDEGWIPALIPIMTLVGVWIVRPCVAARRAFIPLLLIGVFLLHNGFGGMGVIASETSDILTPRTAGLLARTNSGDLVVVPRDWRLERYLHYRSDAEIIAVDRGAEIVGAKIEQALERGGHVFLLEDVPPWASSRAGGNGDELLPMERMAHDYGARAKPVDMGEHSVVYEVLPAQAAR